MIDRETEEQLANWGDWARSGSSHRARCGSAEGRYVAPRPDGEALASATYSRAIDIPAAERVDRAVGQQPPVARQLLIRKYVRRYGDHELRKMLRLRRSEQDRLTSAMTAAIAGVRLALAS